ncbi:hypothetical protein [Clostridium tarantellae]|uniref:Uncharacterized protein n=1 Tax=Clostridium tarantellae TaxID=39493 RepID=A0A6I1MWD0_9CLOT|nr:hypothetical protein [Clostridium tarantellae]MPQ45121.1 hypothetical protein [Clostridium tarantellae]
MTEFKEKIKNNSRVITLIVAESLIILCILIFKNHIEITGWFLIILQIVAVTIGCYSTIISNKNKKRIINKK